jgi:hypothetical protein
VRAVFADAFYWIALLNPDEPDHDLVIAFDLNGRSASSWPSYLCCINS